MLVGATTASIPKPVEATSVPTAEAAKSRERRPAERPDEAALAAPSKAPEKTSRTRLSYNEELSRTFVEVVNIDSGEVVNRFPPEEIVRFMDSLLSQAEASRSARQGNPRINLVV